ncbi:MAG: DNA primase small subunit domain-containing protein [Thermoprotei archaeon]
MDQKEWNSFIRNLFMKYYRDDFSLDNTAIDRFEQREFGFRSFDNIMQRHLSFKTLDELKEFIVNLVPSDAYFSSAFYQKPDEKNMDLKNWLGAELSFDIDIDHVPTKCKYEHDWWQCKSCQFTGKGIAPPKCPKCGSESIESWNWICDNCLNEAKEQVQLLIDEFLISDLGLSPNELIISFSGHRGYHVRVKNSEYEKLNVESRGMIVEHISLPTTEKIIKQVLDELGNKNKNPKILSFYTLNSEGWRGRIMRGLYEIISGYTKEILNELGINNEDIDYIIKSRDRILDLLTNENALLRLRFLDRLQPETIKLLINEAISRKKVWIDERVTKDVRRLLRLPESLHGSTGFKAKLVNYSELNKFNPLKDAVVFKNGDFKIIITDSRVNKITIDDYYFDGTVTEKNKPLSLPLSTAVYLILNGYAKPVGWS